MAGIPGYSAWWDDGSGRVHGWGFGQGTVQAASKPAALSAMSDWDLCTLARSGSSRAFEAQAELRSRSNVKVTP